MEAADTQEGRMGGDDRSQGRHGLDHGRHHHGNGSHHHGHGSHHHDGHESHHHDEPMSQEDALRSLLLLGQVALNAGDYESAVEAYASALQIEANETACYNLGSFYARGVGVRQDFVEAARLFHQAELLGNARAAKLCGKCMFDYISEGLDDKRPSDLYAELAVFVAKVYPEATDHRLEVGRGLFAIGSTYYSKGAYAQAAKVFRAGAEFAGDGYAQYYLAALYGDGNGVQKNDLAALYWLDCAVENGAADVAQRDRDGMLDAYRQALPPAEFREAMKTLSDWCEKGTPDVPANPTKAAFWRGMAEDSAEH